jgi:tetratricopeptide (TPR) repeat protein
MRFRLILIGALAVAAPALALAQSGPTDTNGGDPTSAAAAQLEAQQHDAAATQAALAAGDYKAARKYADRLVHEGARDVGAWLLLGQAERGMEDWKAARRTYSDAVRISPGSVEAHAWLGIARAKTGDPAAARELEWLNARIQAQGCGQACGQLGRFKTDVEAAIAAGPKAG